MEQILEYPVSIGIPALLIFLVYTQSTVDLAVAWEDVIQVISLSAVFNHCMVCPRCSSGDAGGAIEALKQYQHVRNNPGDLLST
jgi:hypothetical protein